MDNFENNSNRAWKSFGIIVAFLSGLAFFCQFATLFGFITLITSFLVFSKIEADQNVYDFGFWFTRFPGRNLLAWFRAFGKLEAISRSILLGLLAWFTFAGDNQVRTIEATWRLCGAALISYLFLSFLVRKAHLNVLRWAYVKLSVILGVVFSILSVIMRTPRRNSAEALWDWIKGKLPGGRDLTVEGTVDQIHITLNDAVELIHEKLDQIVGEPTASIVLVLFNSQVLMGFLVVLYTFLLLLLTMPELRRRPEEDVVQSKETDQKLENTNSQILNDGQ